jgi:predicted dehydrogenase
VSEHVRFGVVGTGVMGAAHAQTLATHPAVDVTLITSRDPETASAVAGRVGARVASDWPDLVADSEVDAVLVATPDHLHTDVAVAAAEAGKAVLIEKPLATSSADASRIVAAVDRAGVVASVLFNHRWVPAYAEAHERIRAGDLGAPVVGYARKNDRIYVPTQMLSWAAQTTPAWFLSSHDLDLLTWFFADQPVEVFATAVHGKLRDLGIDTPDAIQAQVRYAGGAVATFESCWVYPDTFPTMTDSFLEVVGDEGVIHLDRKCEQVELATTKTYEYPRTMLQRSVHGVPAGAVRDCLWHFVDCVRSGTPPLVSVESAAVTTAVLDALHRSAATGTLQRVDPVVDHPSAPREEAAP